MEELLWFQYLSIKTTVAHNKVSKVYLKPFNCIKKHTHKWKWKGDFNMQKLCGTNAETDWVRKALWVFAMQAAISVQWKKNLRKEKTFSSEFCLLCRKRRHACEVNSRKTDERQAEWKIAMCYRSRWNRQDVTNSPFLLFHHTICCSVGGWKWTNKK